MRFFHRTTEGAARSILKNGFVDGEGTYMTGQVFSGVWLSNVPLDSNEGASNGPLLSLNIPEIVIKEFEWIEEGKPYREFLVPAEIVNKYGPPEIVDED